MAEFYYKTKFNFTFLIKYSILNLSQIINRY